jgi:ABC-type nitrate/sulfonate/bicarbonate transport system permease component
MPNRKIDFQGPLSTAASSSLNLIAVLGFLTIWTIVSRSHLVNPLFLPSPLSVVLAIYHLTVSGEMLSAVAVTLSRIAKALLLTIGIGLPLGVLIGSFPGIESLFEPFLRPMRYMPITALLPLFILWLGIGATMKIAFLFTGAVVYLIPLTQNAIHDVRREYMEIGRDLGFSWWETIIKIQLPGAWPQIWSGIVVCNAISWTYVVLAEIINPENGLGYLINIAGRLQKTDQVFASLVFIAVIAIGSDRVLTFIGKRYFNW